MVTNDNIVTVRDRLAAAMHSTSLPPYSQGFIAGVHALAAELTGANQPLMTRRQKMTEVDNYTRSATVVRIIDGDTVVVDVDLGFYLTVRMSCRLYGINTPEMSTPEGKSAREHLASMLLVGDRVTIESIKPDKYAGRFDGVIWYRSSREWGVSLNQRMINDGFAVPYDGGKK